MSQENKNTILILFDQFIPIEKLPQNILNKLNGINYLIKNGIHFKNIRNNRQMCSPSRATIFTSKINHGIQDNIDQRYQYKYIPQVNPNDDTIAKSLKRNNINKTGYYGKSHLISKEDYINFNTPGFNINTTGVMRQYGFNSSNLYGDSFYFEQKGYLADSMYLKTIVNNNIENFDYKDLDGNKFVGAIPFLQQRSVDGQSFHMQFHLTNPHDTQEYWQNLSQEPNAARLQFWAPFLNEQTTLKGINNPYIFNKDFKDGFCTDKELTTNFFEELYEIYKKNESSLINLNSYKNDYCTNSKFNSNDGTLISLYEVYKTAFTMPDSEKDIESWKNLLNNYFGLLIMSNNYLENIIEYLETSGLINNTSIILTSDHGELLGAHGLKQKYVHFEESQRTDVYIVSKDIDKEFIGKESFILGSSIDINPTIEVLSDIKNISKEFLGESLLVKNENGKLIPRNNDNNSLNICNSVMLSSAYLYFKRWFIKQPHNITKKLVNIPLNVGLFKYLFISSTIKYKNDYWKITKYFNLDALLSYNFMNNPTLLNSDGKETKYTFENLLLFLNEKELIEDAKLLEKFKLIVFSNNNKLTLSEITVIINNYSMRDTDIRIIFYLIVFNIINIKLNNIVYLPGVLGESFISQYNNKIHYYYYINNLSKDKDEVLNLADPQNIKDDNINIFEFLNSEQQLLITKYKCKNFYFIPPIIFIISILYYLRNFNKDEIPDALNEKERFSIASFWSNNNFDTSSNTYSGINKIQLI